MPVMNIALKMAIHESRRTQKRIAKLARMSQPRLSLIVRGHEEPTDDEKRKLARVLDRTIDALFGTSDGTSDQPQAVA
jgi:transcriptional regulator with XRE-family HTH domain